MKISQGPTKITFYLIANFSAHFFGRLGINTQFSMKNKKKLNRPLSNENRGWGTFSSHFHYI